MTELSLAPDVLVNRVNALPRYAPTYWDEDPNMESAWANGWIYGVWYCGTSFQKSIYHGQFPMTLVKRITAMFPPDEVDFLHLCCGIEHIDGAFNVDLMDTGAQDLQANVEDLPLKNNSYDVILIDPPYSEEDASRYGVPRLIKTKTVVNEASRILRPGGWLLWLDEKVPNTPKKDWNWVGIVGIITGRNRRARWLAMFQRLEG